MSEFLIRAGNAVQMVDNCFSMHLSLPWWCFDGPIVMKKPVVHSNRLRRNEVGIQWEEPAFSTVLTLCHVKTPVVDLDFLKPQATFRLVFA